MTGEPGRREGLVRLRKATTSDASQAADVWQSAWWDGHRGHVPDELTRHRDNDYFRRQTATWIPLTSLAVDDADSIVGLVIVEDDELIQLAVGREVRRIGVGAALLQAAEDEIGASYESAWLAVVPGNARARQFYEGHGWRDAGSYAHLAPGGPDGISVPTRRYVKKVACPPTGPHPSQRTTPQ